MRLTNLLGKTLRQPPSEAHLPSHQLLARAAFVRGLEGGRMAYLPLGQRALMRLRSLVRREMHTVGGQEAWLPLPTKADADREWVRLVRREIDSYRQLPTILFQMGERLTAQPRTRAGLFGADRRPVVDIYTFDEMPQSTPPADHGRLRTALDAVFAAAEVPVTWAEGGTEGQRAYFEHQAGDEEMVHCPACGYAAERSWATTAWPSPPDEAELPTEEVETPGCDTIAALAEFLGIAEAQTLKMVFCSVEGQVTCVVIRGDRQVDETKLARLLGTDQFYASLEHELEAVGAVGGYASPIGLDQDRLHVVADPSVRSGRNFVSGANRPGYHLRNVNVPRDFRPGAWADLALVEAGDPCPRCGEALEIKAVFSLAKGTPAAPCRPEAEYLDREGRGRPLWMARWQLDLGRLLAAIVESHHDKYGILWPRACAPLDVHLVGLDLRKEAVAAQAESLYDRLQAQGLAVLYDDRTASAGVKFNDADLIGLPLRLTVSKRSVKEGQVEAKWRSSPERLNLDEAGLAAELKRIT